MVNVWTGEQLLRHSYEAVVFVCQQIKNRFCYEAVVVYDL